MRKKSFVYVLGLLFVALMLGSCQKIEGPGGAATIQGKLIVKEYDSAGNLIKTYDGADMDVYIIYGNDPSETYFITAFKNEEHYAGFIEKMKTHEDYQRMSGEMEQDRLSIEAATLISYTNN